MTSEQFKLTFIVGYAIGTWARENDLQDRVNLHDLTRDVTRYIKEATAMLDKPGDFERDAAAEIEKLIGDS